MINIRIDCDEYKTGIVDCKKCVYNKDLKIELLEEEVARLKKEMGDIYKKRGGDINEERYY